MPALPGTMTVITADPPGGPEALRPSARPVPKPGPEEILVKIRAAGVNRPDLLQRAGNYPPPPGASDILGLEFAGEVVARGERAAKFAPGDAVTALVQGGGYAEYCAVDERNALPVPRGFSFVEAAAIPETFFTVWPNMFDRGRLKPGETILIHGGASGIGTTAIQLAKAFGARVIVTAGSEDKCARCRQLGAEVAIDYKTTDFVEAVKEATGGRGADVILDIIGGDYVRRNYQAAADDARIVQVSVMHGPRAETDFHMMMRKRLVHTGSVLRPRDVSFKATVAAALYEKVWPLFEARVIAPVIDATFPLANAADAHRRVDDDHFGKVVLTVD